MITDTECLLWLLIHVSVLKTVIVVVSCPLTVHDASDLEQRSQIKLSDCVHTTL